MEAYSYAGHPQLLCKDERFELPSTPVVHGFLFTTGERNGISEYYDRWFDYMYCRLAVEQTPLQQCYSGGDGAKHFRSSDGSHC